MKTRNLFTLLSVCIFALSASAQNHIPPVFGSDSVLLRKDIMTRSTINVFADDTVEYAAYLIYKNDVNALPVIDKEGKLCGIIAKSDMFRAFVGIMGMNRDCIRVTIEAEDKTGQLADVCNIYKNAGVNIITSSTRQLGNGKAQIIIRGEINENGVGIVEDLRQAGFNVIDVMKLDGLE